MNNLFIEGLQGMGKSTLLQTIAEEMPQYHVCREGEYSPIELAWCAYLTQEQYETILLRYADIAEVIRKNTFFEEPYRIVTYTKIMTDIPGFHKDLEQYEIYNGRKTFAQLKQIVLARYQKFTESGYAFECSFFQNLVEDMILYQMATDDEIVDFYKELFTCVNHNTFRMLYLSSDAIAETIKIIRKERSDAHGQEMWYPLMIAYFEECSYGKRNHLTGFDNLIKHFEHRQRLELRIIKEVIGDCAVILPSKQWKREELKQLCKVSEYR